MRSSCRFSSGVMTEKSILVEVGRLTMTFGICLRLRPNRRGQRDSRMNASACQFFNSFSADRRACMQSAIALRTWVRKTRSRRISA